PRAHNSFPYTTLFRSKHLLTRVEGGLTIHTHLRMDGRWRIDRAGRPIPGGDVVRLILANETWQAVGIRLGVTELLPTDREDRVVDRKSTRLNSSHVKI